MSDVSLASWRRSQGVNITIDNVDVRCDTEKSTRIDINNSKNLDVSSVKPSFEFTADFMSKDITPFEDSSLKNNNGNICKSDNAGVVMTQFQPKVEKVVDDCSQIVTQLRRRPQEFDHSYQILPSLNETGIHKTSSKPNFLSDVLNYQPGLISGNEVSTSPGYSSEMDLDTTQISEAIDIPMKTLGYIDPNMAFSKPYIPEKKEDIIDERSQVLGNENSQINKNIPDNDLILLEKVCSIVEKVWSIDSIRESLEKPLLPCEVSTHETSIKNLELYKDIPETLSLGRHETSHETCMATFLNEEIFIFPADVSKSISSPTGDSKISSTHNEDHSLIKDEQCRQLISSPEESEPRNESIVQRSNQLQTENQDKTTVQQDTIFSKAADPTEGALLTSPSLFKLGETNS